MKRKNSSTKSKSKQNANLKIKKFKNPIIILLAVTAIIIFSLIGSMLLPIKSQMVPQLDPTNLQDLDQTQAQTIAAVSALKVSSNGRFLVKDNGEPFFWLGDTAWELFHRTTREEVDLYLQNRASKKFNVIQAVVIGEKEGLTATTPYGQLPFVNRDPTKPNDAYFQHVDYVVQKANSLGMYIGMLPTWGSHVSDGGAVFTTANARVFGQYLGNRYKNSGIIWILGGDRGSNAAQKEVWKAMGEGIKVGAGNNALLSYHPPGGSSSTFYFPNSDPLLNFNMRQNGHCGTDKSYNLSKIAEDYNRTPIKPIIDGEPLYEDHPICFNFSTYSLDLDIRRHAYTDVFAGAFGHTYGHHSIWQFWQDRYYKTNNPIMSWQEALNRPGGDQMRHLRALMESRPFLMRIPDQAIVVTPNSADRLIVATRDSQGSYAMVYFPYENLSTTIRTSSLSGSQIRAWWFNPRDGKTYNSSGQLSSAFTTFTKGQDQTFDPPGSSNLDWILVLDDTSRNFNAPGIGTNSNPPQEPTLTPTPSPSPSPSTPVSPSPTPSTPVAQSPTPSITPIGNTGALFKAINLNGPTLTADGITYQAESTAGVSISSSRFENQSVPLINAPSAAKAQMIRSSVWGTTNSPTIDINNVPEGTYQVYFYTWEDNNAETYNVYIEGTFRETVNSGTKGTWKRLGPYTAQVTDGKIDLDFTGGAANISGIEIYSTTTQPSAPTATPTSTPTTGSNNIELYARGTPLNNIYPILEVYINGIKTNQIQTTAALTKYIADIGNNVPVQTVEIKYINDDYQPSPIVDRNVLVDKIVVNGTTFETESPTVYSTGTWTAADGCAPGNKQSEWLNCNGSFTYRISGAPSTSTCQYGPYTIPGRIEAENYSCGGQGVSFNDFSNINEGKEYRNQSFEQVDIEPTTDVGRGYNVGWTRSGEWIRYSLNAGQTKNYTIKARVANQASTGKFRLKLDGVDLVGQKSVPLTSGWQNWTTLTLGQVNISQGLHTLELAIEEDFGNYNYFDFE